VAGQNYLFAANVNGIGKSQYPLVAFDNALRNAGIGDFNLVKVSSIIPASCVYQERILVESRIMD
jgi:pyruvoyl-dependent arginine decarboxylase